MKDGEEDGDVEEDGDGSSKMEMGKEMTGGRGGVGLRYEEGESNNRNAETDSLQLH
jgi:hypothetical protein